MIRNGKTFSFLKQCIRYSDWRHFQNPRYLVPLRYYAKDGGKGAKGKTARVDECIPSGSQKVPSSNNSKCGPPNKIKIPHSPPKPNKCPPAPCPPSLGGAGSRYKDCQPGGNKQVMQVCRKPNPMDECSNGGDRGDGKKKLVRNVLLLLAALGILGYMLCHFEVICKPSGQSGGGAGRSAVSVGEKCDDDENGKKRRRSRVCQKNPSKGKDFPKTVPYLLVGGGTAAFSAFRSIKSLDPTAKVLVISTECEFPYMRPPLSKEMWFNADTKQVEKLMFKQWNGSVRSLFYEPDSFYAPVSGIDGLSKGGVAVAKGWTVTKIDPYERKATLDDGTVITYGKCLIATGSRPKNLDTLGHCPGPVMDRIQTYRDIHDFKDLNEMVEESETVAIIGGGFLGSELACALARRGKAKNLKVVQVFKESGNMGKVLPEYLSLWTTKKVEEEGVTVMSGTQVVDGTVVDGKLKLVLSNGKSLGVDHCVVAVGAVPNTDLAGPSDLEVDPKLGGYLVNAELEARSHLYIAGDAACFYDVKLGRRRVEHHDHAVVSGRLAGENMVGAGKPYWHQSMFWSDLGPGVGYEAIGIVDSKLPTVGVFAKQTTEDTPEAVVDATNESVRSATEESATPPPPSKGSRKPPQPGEDYSKGVIFYLRDDLVVGIVMWNVFNRMQVARQVLKDEKKYADLNEVAKLFGIHED